MSYSKLIHDYLDGDLSLSQQDLLFSELANNTELRQEFNQQVRLQTLAQSDLSSITPPSDAANSVFANLGFSIPNADFTKNFYPAKPAPSFIFWKSTVDFLKRRFPTFLTSVFSATVTALIFLYFLNNSSLMNDSLADGSSRRVISSNLTELSLPKSSNPQPVVSLTKNVPDTDFERLFSRALSDYFARNPINNTFILPNETILKNKNDESIAKDNSSNNNFSKEDKEQKIYQDQFPLVLLPNSNRIERPENLGFNDVPTGNLIDDLVLSLRSFNSQASTKVNLPSNANPWFNNMAMALAYNLDKYHSFGLEVGQEQFAQRFQRTEYDLTTTYEQNPLLLWYGGFYRFSFPDLIFNDKIYPFAQIFGGATSIGPIFKSQIGFQYKPDKRVTFVLGGEVTRLLYNLQNNFFNTDKFGITYGISIQY